MKNNQKNTGRVLIVEDDTLLSMVEERLIVRLGYKVVGKATTGKEAIDKVKSLQPDIIIMDLSLKGSMDGIETMDEISTFSDVPVIYLSGSTDKHDKERAKKTNAVDFLMKPVSASEMVLPLKKAMNRVREQEKILSQAG
ncbi:MAG: response regulator [Balneolaceae bacterium]